MKGWFSLGMDLLASWECEKDGRKVQLANGCVS